MHVGHRRAGKRPELWRLTSKAAAATAMDRCQIRGGSRLPLRGCTQQKGKSYPAPPPENVTSTRQRSLIGTVPRATLSFVLFVLCSSLSSFQRGTRHYPPSSKAATRRWEYPQIMHTGEAGNTKLHTRKRSLPLIIRFHPHYMNSFST